MIAAQHRICPKCGLQMPSGTQCAIDGTRLVEDRSDELIDERFVLRQPIGVGGMGSGVWRAEQISTGRDVAFKILRPGNREAGVRFMRGAIISSHLNHPNITTTHAVGRHVDGSHFLVMEHLDGVVLRTVMQDGPMPVERIIALVDQLLSALSHMQARGVVHLDIKPGNLFLVGSPARLKVLDFDIADVADGASDRLRSAMPPRGTGVCGTPQYMAPEVLRGDRADHRADLYAVGVLMFELLTTHLPYPTIEPDALMRAHRRGEPQVKLLRHADRRLIGLILRALRPNPKLRFDNANAMRRALRDTERSAGSLPPIAVSAVNESEPEAEPRGSTTMPCRPTFGPSDA